jgi:hypothetical protein
MFVSLSPVRSKGARLRLLYKARLWWWLLKIRIAAIAAVGIISTTRHRRMWRLLLLPSSSPRRGLRRGLIIRLADAGTRWPHCCEIRHFLCYCNRWKTITGRKNGDGEGGGGKGAEHGLTPFSFLARM